MNPAWAQENKENPQDDWCDLSGGKKATLSIVEMAYTGAATDIERRLTGLLVLVLARHTVMSCSQ